MTERLEIKAALDVTDEGEITGIAWPFGAPDRVGDVIGKGAITAPGTVPMLFAHDQSQVIGIWDQIAEADEGLTVKGRLLIHDVERAREVRAMIRSKAVSGLSIGFVTKGAKRHAKGRTITAAELHEISVVAVPCHPGAQITSVKSDDTAMHHEETPDMENEEIEQKIEAQTPANDAPQLDTKAFNELKARLDRLEAKGNRPRVTGTPDPVMGRDEVKAFTNFLRSGDRTETKSLAYGSGTGGILAPETVSKNILEKIAEFSPVRGVAQVIQMNGPLLQLPRLVTEVTVGEVAEGDTKPESEPTFEQIDLKPFEMGVVVPVTKILLEDAHVDLAAYLGNHVARRFGQKEAAWFINGNGTTQAEGVLTSAEVQEVATGTSLSASKLVDLFYSVKTAYSTHGSWLMNRKTMAEVRLLTDSNGSFLWQPSLAAGQPPTLLGRPVYEAVDLPDPVEDASPIVFGDFATGYAVADRIGFEIIRDELTGAASGMVKLVARRRVGGGVVMGEAISKLTLSLAA
jgi:HK97 family phage major capsid protein/HK97 family phage prohead protease